MRRRRFPARRRRPAAAGAGTGVGRRRRAPPAGGFSRSCFSSVVSRVTFAVAASYACFSRCASVLQLRALRDVRHLLGGGRRAPRSAPPSPSSIVRAPRARASATRPSASAPCVSSISGLLRSYIASSSASMRSWSALSRRRRNAASTSPLPGRTPATSRPSRTPANHRETPASTPCSAT